jgi:hypothetical protein
MPALVSHLLRRAKHLREQAERALRLSRQTTAEDVAKELHEYAAKLENEAQALDREAALAAQEQPRPRKRRLTESRPARPPGRTK